MLNNEELAATKKRIFAALWIGYGVIELLFLLFLAIQKISPIKFFLYSVVIISCICYVHKKVTAYGDETTEEEDDEEVSTFPFATILIGLFCAGIVLIAISIQYLTQHAPKFTIALPSIDWGNYQNFSIIEWLIIAIFVVVVLWIIVSIVRFFTRKDKESTTTTTATTKTRLPFNMVWYGLGVAAVGAALYVLFYLALAIRIEGWHFIESVPRPTETTVHDNFPSFETLDYGRHYLSKKGRYKFLMPGNSQLSTVPQYYFSPEKRETMTFRYEKLAYEKEVFWSYKVTRTGAHAVSYKLLTDRNDGSGGWVKVKPDHDGYVVVLRDSIP